MNVAEFAKAMAALNAQFEEAVEQARHVYAEKSRAVLREFLGENLPGTAADEVEPGYHAGFLAERARAAGEGKP